MSVLSLIVYSLQGNLTNNRDGTPSEIKIPHLNEILALLLPFKWNKIIYFTDINLK